MAHALLSPSSAQRWSTCTPSARLEANFPDTAGQAAAEGTLAHAIAEALINLKLKRMTRKEFYSFIKISEADPLYNTDLYSHAEAFCDFVLERYAEAVSRTPDALIFTEKKLDLTAIIPDGFGTADAVIIADGFMEVIDFKYGKGVEVSAQENKQMMLYGFGALNEYAILYDITALKLTIYQPRIGNYSTYELPSIDLIQWAYEDLRFKAEMAHKGEGELVTGSHCKFCKAKAVCRAFHDQNVEIAKHDFKQPNLLTADEISNVLQKADIISEWITAVENYALAKALEGEKWPGFKLVEGRSVRVITDPEKAAEKLIGNGFKVDQIYDMKMKGITALEKELTKAKFSELLGDFILKPPGKPTLAPESDKRPELNSADAAANDFK